MPINEKERKEKKRLEEEHKKRLKETLENNEPVTRATLFGTGRRITSSRGRNKA